MSFKELETQDLESMLAAATPGPWNAGKEGIDGPGYAEVFAADTEEKGIGYMAYEVPLLAGDRLDRDLPLAALAPEAVAEVIRLRRELEKLKGDLNYSALCAKAQGENGAVQTTAAKRITRILEGTDA